MPDNRELDDPDRDLEDDDFEDAEDEIIDLEDEGEEAVEDVEEGRFEGGPHRTDTTREVGSEGGSPGEAMRRGQFRERAPGGSEATETLPPTGGREQTIDQRDRAGRTMKRPPV